MIDKQLKKPITFWAEQWFPDHPVAGVLYPVPDDGADISFHRLHGENYGLLLTAEGAHVIVSAGDWIITGMAVAETEGTTTEDRILPKKECFFSQRVFLAKKVVDWCIFNHAPQTSFNVITALNSFGAISLPQALVNEYQKEINDDENMKLGILQHRRFLRNDDENRDS